METVTIDGIEYVKASALARQHGYTADYIGQLCRGNKVDAHLVGRTWYVYPPSLDSHKTSRYAELRFSEKTSVETNKTTSSRRDVTAPPAKNTSKSVAANFTHRVIWRDQNYTEDESDLLPSLKKDSSAKAPTSMKVRLAESRQVSIVGRSDKVTLVSEPPPAIALAGTLKVQSYEPRFEEFEDEKEDASEAKKKVENTSHVVDNRVAVDLLDDQSETAGVVSVARSETKTQFPVYNVPLRKQTIEHAPLSFSPKTVISQAKGRVVPSPERRSISVPEKSPAEAVAQDPSHSIFFNLVIAPAMVLLVVVVAGSFFFLESLTEVNARGEQVKVINLRAAIFETFF